MVLLEILTRDSPVGHPGEHYGYFLSEEGYKNAKEHERNGEISIYYHAAVSGVDYIRINKRWNYA